jgi:putative ABC transport system ATP-binding protein
VKVAPILETRELRKVYDAGGVPVVAVDGVSVSIESGEFVAIMGRSGCGKSSLLHQLGGLDRPTSGEVYFDGTRVDTLTEAQWAQKRRSEVGFVFQFFNLIPNLSVADNIELPALVLGVPTSEARERRRHLLDELDISDLADSLPSHISGGEQQRVAIARALINDPAVLLADEPTGNLDSQAAQGVIRVLRERNLAGQTIVMVTHDPTVAAGARRTLEMLDGRVVKDSGEPGGKGLSASLASSLASDSAPSAGEA